jgi:hypothetical protein
MAITAKTEDILVLLKAITGMEAKLALYEPVIEAAKAVMVLGGKGEHPLFTALVDAVDALQALEKGEE